MSHVTYNVHRKRAAYIPAGEIGTSRLASLLHAITGTSSPVRSFTRLQRSLCLGVFSKEGLLVCSKFGFMVGEVRE